jgi:LacI family transcriptional regulator
MRVVDALRERGVRSEDAVVGLENWDWDIIAGATRPPLTTIDMNLHELERQAGRRMLAMINDETTHAGVLRLACRIVRQSGDALSAGFAHQAAGDVTRRAAQ